MCINIKAMFSFAEHVGHHAYIFVRYLLSLVLQTNIVSNHFTEDGTMIIAFNRVEKGQTLKNRVWIILITILKSSYSQICGVCLFFCMLIIRSVRFKFFDLSLLV